jgi:hypothetical protein
MSKKKKIEEIEEDIIIDDDEDDYEESSSGFFRKLFFSLILIIVLTVIYARYIGTSGLFIKEYNIVNNKLPESFNGLKIAHFSDFHYGTTTNLDSLKKLVDEINLMKPDIIVFTGDFIDKNVKVSDDEINNITTELLKLDSTYGNYYINGNHDIKFDKYDEMMTNSNFINLNDNYDIIYNKNNDAILINGLSFNSNLDNIKELFNNELPAYKINIMHTPDTLLDIKDYNFDLVLAGHSHNGQVAIPFYGALYTPKGAKTYYKPYYKVDSTDLYISSGIGTSNYNFRLFNRPSFNFYRLKNS